MGVLMAEPAVAGRWRWRDQETLLERQHDRLEALLAELLHRHGPDHPIWSAAEALAVEGSCRRLLWSLRLHVRLEERWLARHGCLCQGHRAAHQEALEHAITGFQASAADRGARRQWLLVLQAWFRGHRHGPDAIAYSLAANLSVPRP